MKLKVIASGSSGNCYLLENERECLVIEAGISLVEVKKALDFNIRKIKCVLVSHGHNDHSKYVKDYQKAGIPVVNPFETGVLLNMTPVVAGNFNIQAFENRDKDGKWLHNNSDGSECPCYGFFVRHKDIGRLVYATDTEYVRWRFKGINHIMIESNYDTVIVDKEDPKYQHVMRGHMSLKTALEFVSVNDNTDLRNVVLCHLSDTNADPDAFLKSAREVTDKEVYIARKGLEINLDLVPF